MLTFKPTGSLPLRQSRSNLIGMVVISGVSRTASPEAVPALKATGLLAPRGKRGRYQMVLT